MASHYGSHTEELLISSHHGLKPWKPITSIYIYIYRLYHVPTRDVCPKRPSKAQKHKYVNVTPNLSIIATRYIAIDILDFGICISLKLDLED